ncbi:hypothetical protein UFOVP1356_22 [uncultured Caudovirales phage]|uniref:Uncharacterized protein n=1 Tax=uncultured Caudovirales phage TaxID=2100421 RepID=A0A6J5S1B3_9CAUD|nr:hypothetical protein UFOVP1356_22 [uncultured Caudovirales phage]
MTPAERAEFIADVAAAIQVAPVTLSDDEQRWVRMAIQREAQSIELRKAIIEKTLGGLVWAALVGFGYLLVDFLKNHGFK